MSSSVFRLKNQKSIKYLSTLMLFIFIGISTQVKAQSAGFNNTFVVLSINGGGNAYYDLQATTANQDFQNANLGSFSSSNSLVLKGAEHNVYKCGGCDLTSTRINYRIYLTSTAPGAFSILNIGYTSGSTNGCGGQDQQWSKIDYTTNLLTGLSAGNYTFELYSDATTTCLGNTVYASNSGSNYKATFTVIKAESTISVTGTTSFTYDNTPQGPSAAIVIGSTGAVTYSYEGVSPAYGPSTIAPTLAGSYTVTATLAADSNYNGASSSATSFTIGASTYIPDANFEQALINLLLDSGTIDHYVLTNNISGITALDVSNKSISNLTGIQDFVSLETLNCSTNSLTSLNVSTLTALKNLHCFENNLGTLNLTSLTNLEILDCNTNALTNLDISSLTKLKDLDCYINSLTSLDVSEATLLGYMDCGNNIITSLDVTGLTSLYYLYTGYNNLSTLNLTDLLASADMYCYNNPLLSCIIVDDPAVAALNANWQKDGFSAYSKSNSTAQTGNVTGGTSVCMGSTSGLLALNDAIGTIARWESAVSPFTTWTTISNTSNTYTSGVLMETTQFRAITESNCQTYASTPTTVTIESNTWTGAVDSSWTNAGNWSCGVPISASNVTINSGTNQPIIASNVTINNMTIDASASLTLNSGVNLTVTGTITNAGAITNSGLINNTGTITNTGIIKNTSNVSGTGYLLSNSSIANVTQEHYLTSNQRGWRLLSNPLSTITFGTLASGSTTPFTLGANASGAYNSVGDSWTNYTDTDNMVSQQAYKVFVRGRSIEVTGLAYSVHPPSHVILSVTGTAANTVPTAITTLAGQYYLVANPYTAPLSVAGILAVSSGLSSSVSYYNPTKASAGGTDLEVKKGGYDVISVSGVAGSANDVVLPPMGAIFVLASSAGTINIPKTAIFTGNVLGGNYNHKTANTQNVTPIALTVNVSSNGVDYDKLQLRFKETGTAGSNIDFGKMPNTILDFYSIDGARKNMAVSELELVAQTIPLGINSTALQSFMFKIVENSIPTGFEAALEDKWLNTSTVLTAGTNYDFSINATAASQGAARFAITLKTTSPLSVKDNMLDAKIVIWPNPAHNQFYIKNNQVEGDTTFKIYSLTGQLIHSDKAVPGATTTINTSGWASGQYLLEASNSGNKTTKQLIIQ